jgi:glyoxylase-like metal-dependent hydrolase (beta-lactamase superfamily II)
VDVVFFTHLHVDHVGWNTDRDGVLVFPNARYVAHRDGIAFACNSGRPHIERTILAVEFEEIDGEAVVAQGVTAFPLPGHFPGHMGLRIESEGERAVLIADAAVNPMLLDQPDHTYVSESDAAACAATRRALLQELLDQEVLTVCGHYPAGGIGRVVTREAASCGSSAVREEIVFLKHKLPHGSDPAQPAVGRPEWVACVSETQSLVGS